MCARTLNVSELKWENPNVVVGVAFEALYLVGQRALAIAMPNIPLETGTLRRSGTVTVGALPSAKEIFDSAFGMPREHVVGKIQSELFYGKLLGGDKTVYVTYSTPYAVRLHEDMNWKPRDWKYAYRSKKKGKFRMGPSKRYGFEGMFYTRVSKPAVGGPKWLSKAMPEAWKQLNEILAFVRAKRAEGRRRK